MSEDIRKFLDIVKDCSSKILTEDLKEIMSPHQAWDLEKEGPIAIDIDKLANDMAEIIDHAIIARNSDIAQIKVVKNDYDSIIKVTAEWDLVDTGNKAYEIHFAGIKQPIGIIPFDMLHDMLKKLKEIYFEEGWQVLSMGTDTLIIGHTRSA